MDIIDIKYNLLKAEYFFKVTVTTFFERVWRFACPS